MGPFKCPECGIWWAGLEHRCAPLPPATTTIPGIVWPTAGTVTVRCTCPPDRGDNYFGTCLLHDVQVTYTAMGPLT